MAPIWEVLLSVAKELGFMEESTWGEEVEMLVDVMKLVGPGQEVHVAQGELVVEPATTPQVFCHMSVLEVTTNKRQHTGMWVKVQVTSRWLECPPTSGQTFVCASSHFFFCCCWFPFCYICFLS